MDKSEELAYYKMNLVELQIWNGFSDEIVIDCKKMNIAQEHFHYVTDNLESKNYCHTCGYSEKYGYFMVDFGDRGGFTSSILTRSVQQAKLDFLKRILWNISIQYECQNRQVLKQKWNCSTKYDGRKYSFDYTILKLHQIYSYEEIKDYIVERTQYMNRWFYDQHWAYSEEQNQFIEVSQSLEHD